MPKLQHQDLQTSAQQIARERGLDTDSRRKVYLPVIRAYRVGPELVAWADGKTCASWAFTARPAATLSASAATAFSRTRTAMWCCRWAMISPVGYPMPMPASTQASVTAKGLRPRSARYAHRHRRDRGQNHNAVGRRTAQLKLTDHGCFLNRVIRSQIEMPIDDNVVLNKGDVLQVSGDARRVKTVADRIGFISIHSR